jgi:hypothetical protein
VCLEAVTATYVPLQIFKGYTIQVLVETMSFVQDLKLGHYIKVPPRASFIGQFKEWLMPDDFVR